MRRLQRIKITLLLLSSCIILFCGIVFVLGKNHSHGPEPVSGKEASITIESSSESGQETEKITKPVENPEASFDSSQETIANYESPQPARHAWVDYEEDYLNVLQSRALEEPQIWEILDNRFQYPDKVLEMLSKNEETLNFVLDYPEKSKLPPSDTIGEIPKDGTIPLLLQWDERWGYAPYGSDAIVATSGCGPTCIAMVASGLTKDNTITPAIVAEYASSNGYLTAESNTSWDLMTQGCEHFGIIGSQLSLNEDIMAETLQSGSPIICSMAPGIFTTGGHFIVLTGYQNGRFTVNDPASKVRSAQTYAYDEFQDQVKNLWYFIKGDILYDEN